MRVKKELFKLYFLLVIILCSSFGAIVGIPILSLILPIMTIKIACDFFTAITDDGNKYTWRDFFEHTEVHTQ